MLVTAHRIFIKEKQLENLGENSKFWSILTFPGSILCSPETQWP